MARRDQKLLLMGKFPLDNYYVAFDYIKVQIRSFGKSSPSRTGLLEYIQNYILNTSFWKSRNLFTKRFLVVEDKLGGGFWPRSVGGIEITRDFV